MNAAQFIALFILAVLIQSGVLLDWWHDLSAKLQCWHALRPGARQLEAWLIWKRLKRATRFVRLGWLIRRACVLWRDHRCS